MHIFYYLYEIYENKRNEKRDRFTTIINCKACSIVVISFIIKYDKMAQ